jgi:uncharacterized protein
MTSRNSVFPFFAVLCLFFLLPSISPAVSIPPSPGSYVVDLAGIVNNDTERKLNGYLQELEQKTTAQLVVLTIKSLDGESVADFSIRVAHDKWKLGQRGKDNGLLLLIALNDRKYRIEVGYGLEGVLPDSFVGSVGRDFLVPYFKKGEPSKGIYAAMLAMANEVARDAGVTITGMPRLKGANKAAQPPSFFRKVISAVFFIFLFIFFLKNPRAFLLFFLFSSMGSGRRTWGGGGGGFGSFGGGGGGGFGGGGASGGW